MNYTRILVYFMLVTCLASCSPSEKLDIPDHILDLESLIAYPANENPLHEINMTRDVIYGDMDEVILGQISRITVDDRGRVYLKDDQVHTIHIYEPDGTYSGNIGREGEGPGEFQFILKVLVSDGHLYALDFMSQRISIFNVDTYMHIKDLNVSLEMVETDPS